MNELIDNYLIPLIKGIINKDDNTCNRIAFMLDTLQFDLINPKCESELIKEIKNIQVIEFNHYIYNEMSVYVLTQEESQKVCFDDFGIIFNNPKAKYIVFIE